MAKYRFIAIFMVIAIALVNATVVELEATRDTFVQGGVGANNSNSASNQIVIGSGNADQTRYGYMAFSLDNLVNVNVDDIQSATLKLHWALYSGGATATGVLDRPGGTWNNTLTYNTQPTGFVTVANWAINSAQTTGYNLTVDITNLVKAWKAGTVANNGFRMRYYGGNPYSYLILDSMEEVTRGLNPIIEVDYIPEPATLSILGLGGLLLRRRA